VLFFSSSFGLAIIANGKSATVNDLDLDIPALVLEGAPMDEMSAVESELPVIETEVPAATTTEQDVPDL